MIIFWRLFWKEYRLQRALWIAMAVLTAMVQLAIYGALAPIDRPLFLFWTAGGFPALYLLGCGATLFAGEHDAGTFDFQRALPVRAATVFLAKTTLALSSGVAMIVPAVLLAFALGGWTLDPEKGFSPLAVLLVSGFFGVELLFWSMAFSLLTRRVLTSAVLGVAAASAMANMLANIAMPNAFDAVTYSYWLAMPYRVVAAALVALLDFSLAAGWFRERAGRICLAGPLAAGSFSRHFKHRPQAARLNGLCQQMGIALPDRATMYSRLAWQHRRQAWPLMLVICLCAAIPRIGLLLMPLVGLCAFLPDQRGHGFRFLTDRGVSPGRIWISRQWFLLVPTVFVLAVSIVVAYFMLPKGMGPEELQQFFSSILPHLTIYVLTAVALGQMMSMFVRSGILAGLFSVLAAVPLAGWTMLMFFWCVPWWWSVLPIPLAMLLATRLRTRDWLLERNTPRAWLRPTLALVAPAAALLVAVPLYRIYQIPSAGIDREAMLAEMKRPPTAEEQATMLLYEQAWQHHFDRFCQRNDDLAKVVTDLARLPDGKLVDWLDANQETIAIAVKASRGKIFDPDGRLTSHLTLFPDLLVRDAKRLESKGQLDQALEHYMASLRIVAQYRDLHQVWWDTYLGNFAELRVYNGLRDWASRPHQTRERLLAAQRELAAYRYTNRTSLERYYLLNRMIDDAPNLGDKAWVDDRDKTLPSFLLRLWTRLPWERERSRRIVDLCTCWEHSCMSSEIRRFNEGLQCHPRMPSELLFILAPYERNELTRIFPRLVIGYDNSANEREARGAVEAARSATRTVLLLKSWKLEHGSLPKTLDQLIGPDVKELPLDPYSGRPFLYYPEGLKAPLYSGKPAAISYDIEYTGPVFDREKSGIDANKPFIWSLGDRVRHDWDAEEETCWFKKYQILSPTGVPFVPRSEHDLLESGWVFPIP